MATVQFKGVSKVYGEHGRAVDSVDLSIADGEFVVIVGPSGCGKSTTLRMIAGLEEISSGTILIGDRVINDVAPKDRNIAMVFQNYALYSHLNVRQNLAFGLERRRETRSLVRALWDSSYRLRRREESAKIAGRVDAVARTLEIESLLHRPPRELSGGQRQRVAVGRAFVRDPAVFLFDEPLSNLDASLRGEMRTELRILHRRLRATMIYVTHDQEEAISLADRIVVMKDGVVQQVGSPAEVYERPANQFVAGFVGTPSMNMLSGQIVAESEGVVHFRGDQCELSFPSTRWQDGAITSASEDSTLGIRPDRLKPVQADGGRRDLLRGSVVAIERFGSLADVAVTLRDDARITARCSLDEVATVREGDSILLQADPNCIHFFRADGVSIERSTIQPRAMGHNRAAGIIQEFDR